MDKQSGFKILLSVNGILHFISACMAGVWISDAMSNQEGATGAFSREGGDVGRVAITLSNIADGCKSARNSIYANRAFLSRQFARADRILIDLRRVIDSENDRHKKMIDARKLADEWQRVMRGINDALAAEALIAASESLTKDWHAAGLPVAAANAITQNFDGIADALVEGLDDIAALKERPLPGIPVVSNIAYLGMYPDATISAVAIGAIIEVLLLISDAVPYFTVDPWRTQVRDVRELHKGLADG